MGTDLGPSPLLSPATNRLARVMLAALRLGAIYAVAVTAIFLLVLLVMNAGAIPILEIMTRIWIPTAALTLLAFATLAVTRGVGFLLLWGLTLVAWLFMLRLPPITSAFAVWTILAAPLAAIVAVGQPRSATVSPRTTLLRRGITVAWLILFALAIASEMSVGEYVSLGRPPEWLMQILRPVWLVTPFMIGAHGVFRALTMLRAHKTPAA